ncbi:hypothetical protein [Candidatus Solincola sp.]|jgi:hypothetical protein|nr:hypothetical protein [Actinomycetota bacterium]
MVNLPKEVVCESFDHGSPSSLFFAGGYSRIRIASVPFGVALTPGTKVSLTLGFVAGMTPLRTRCRHVDEHALTGGNEMHKAIRVMGALFYRNNHCV